MRCVYLKIFEEKIPTDNPSINFLGTSNPLYEDCCEFFDDFMKELFLDKNFSFSSSKKLIEKLKLEEEEKMISNEEKLG